MSVWLKKRFTPSMLNSSMPPTSKNQKSAMASVLRPTTPPFSMVSLTKAADRIVAPAMTAPHGSATPCARDHSRSAVKVAPPPMRCSV